MEEAVLICCWSSKGGAGTTVVAASLALMLASRTPGGALLADLAGDAPTVLGLPVDPVGPGITDWLGGTSTRPPELRVAPGLGLLLRGLGPPPPAGVGADQLLDALVADPRPVVVDAGVIGTPTAHGELALAVASSATHSLLVVRQCFMALRRALLAPLRPSAVVLVEDVGRALTAADVEEALGVPVRARVHTTAQIARVVDAGLLAVALPRSLERDLRDAA
jgi:hypothetical protein